MLYLNFDEINWDLPFCKSTAQACFQTLGKVSDGLSESTWNEQESQWRQLQITMTSFNDVLDRSGMDTSTKRFVWDDVKTRSLEKNMYFKYFNWLSFYPGWITCSGLHADETHQRGPYQDQGQRGDTAKQYGASDSATGICQLRRLLESKLTTSQPSLVINKLSGSAMLVSQPYFLQSVWCT